MTVAALTGVIVLLAGGAVRPRSLRSTGRGPIATRPEPSGPARMRKGRIAAVSIVSAAAAVVEPTLVVFTAIVLAASLALRRRRRRAAIARAVEAAMPDAIELLVVSLHAGRSPAQAIVELARIAPAAVRPAFAAVEHRLHRGHGLGEALDELTARCGRCALGLVTAVGAAVRDGLPLTPVLDRLTDDAHAARRRQGEAAARRLPVRLSFPLVLCTLPSFVLVSIVPAVLGALSTLRGTAP